MATRDGLENLAKGTAATPGHVGRSGLGGPGGDDQATACHLVGLFLLDEFAKVCSTHGLRFFLDAGTALGAVRHQGWIPWDDDVDVCMLREDFMQLIRLPAEVFPPELALSVPGREPDHVTTVARLNYLPSGLRWVERLGAVPPERQRIVLDIYVLDRAPAAPLVPLWLASTRILQVVAAARGIEFSAARQLPTPSERGLALLLASLSRMAPLSLIHGLNRRISACSKKDRGTLYALNHGWRARGTAFDAQWLRAGSQAVFEGRRCSVAEPAPYLAALYGPDYMTPPPIEERVGHHYESFWARFDGIAYGLPPEQS